MLNRLLELLRAGGTHRVADLARELGATLELIEMALEDLCRMGHLKREGGRVWTLTEKGQGTAE